MMMVVHVQCKNCTKIVYAKRRDIDQKSFTIKWKWFRQDHATCGMQGGYISREPLYPRTDS